MSDETSQSPTEEGDPASPKMPQKAQPEVPVGDMTEEGQTEVGPLPSLTHIENMEQADLPTVAKDNAEAQSSQE
jgi:hypothetical protein